MHHMQNALQLQCMHHTHNACMQVIDPVCGRHTAVLKSSKVLLRLSSGPDQPEVMILPRHKKFEGAGKKATTKTKVSMCRHLALVMTSTSEQIQLAPTTDNLETVLNDEASCKGFGQWRFANAHLLTHSTKCMNGSAIPLQMLSMFQYA